MGFEQLAFSIAHLGLLHSLPAKWLRPRSLASARASPFA